MSNRHCAAAAFLVAAVLTGCSGLTDDSGSPDEAKPLESAESVESAEPRPRTAADFLARAEQAMAAEKGWTFAVEGREGIVLQGQESAATYTATVHRTTGGAWALHSQGSSRSSKGVTEAEEIYVVDGTAYVKEGTAAWKHGPLSDPEFADQVEDPVAALDAFREYGEAVSVSEDEETDGGVRLSVRTTSAALTAVREQRVVQKALRELAPTLKQLRAAGVTAPESRIRVERVEESVVLAPSTYRITAHTFRCAFLIPYGGRDIRYDQLVTERTSGAYEEAVALPEGVA
ncbi:hypothetical protein EJ357_28840 [Streptomyces cyaneochromogenes]|uniref:Lipoprotein n=1 Tax=Streptomyces cyaneochromogenes TaxID=2496836 RepID=A0A3Q9EVZ3_9ACTN|nr:hypothetical protein [Streptomyces cyaneochromogenes]AZQ36961.1 hypothetical protein EJ357_28840 [Streptomyces cyaneochromogenes]